MCSLRYWAASMGRPESTHPVAPSRSAFVATPCFLREPDTSPVRPHDGLNLSHHCNGLTCPYLPNGFQLELSRVLRTHLLFTHLSTPCRYFQQGLRTPLFRGNLTFETPINSIPLVILVSNNGVSCSAPLYFRHEYSAPLIFSLSERREGEWYLTSNCPCARCATPRSEIDERARLMISGVLQLWG